jgi:hypothetical protein
MLLQQFWCWIHPGSRYNAQRIVGEYVWIWSVVVISVFTYIPLALVVRGNLSVSANYWWKFTFHQKQEGRRKPMLMMIAYVGYQLKLESVKLILTLHQLPRRILHTGYAYQCCPLAKLWEY